MRSRSGSEEGDPGGEIDVSLRGHRVADAHRVAEHRDLAACSQRSYTSSFAKRPSTARATPVACFGESASSCVAGGERAHGERPSIVSIVALRFGGSAKTCSGAIVSTAKPRIAPPIHGASGSTSTSRTCVAA